MERKKHRSLRLTVMAIVAALGLSNCSTTYDAYGRPVETVDSGAVVLGAVVLVLPAKAFGKKNAPGKLDNDYDNFGRRHHRAHHRQGFP